MHTLTGLPPTILSTAAEEDLEPEVFNITDIQESHHQFSGTVSSHIGQTFILTLTQIDCTTKLVTIIGIDTICIPHLNHSCHIPNNSYHNTSNVQCNIDMHLSMTLDLLGSLQN